MSNKNQMKRTTLEPSTYRTKPKRVLKTKKHWEMKERVKNITKITKTRTKQQSKVKMLIKISKRMQNKSKRILLPIIQLLLN